jgi:hypothetical protein
LIIAGPLAGRTLNAGSSTLLCWLLDGIATGCGDEAFDILLLNDIEESVIVITLATHVPTTGLQTSVTILLIFHLVNTTSSSKSQVAARRVQ